ncbi:MAG: TIM barrel protein [Candidatus Heimdallarchaeaceae archaeon]
MKLIGQTVQHYKEIKCEQLISFARLIGMESVEINPQGVSLDNVKAVIRALGNLPTTYHLPIVGESGYDFSFTNENEKIKGVITLLDRYAEDLNIQVGVFHPIEDHQKGDFQTLVDNLGQLNIPIILENVQSYSNEEFIDFYQKIKEELPDLVVGWLFDVAHSYLKNGLNDMMTLLDLLPFEELIEIHLSDCLETEDSHYSFGSGILPIKQIIAEIEKRNFNGYLINEIDAYPSIWSVIDSYLEVAKHFKKRVYWRVKARKTIVKPLVNFKLRRAGIK